MNKFGIIENEGLPYAVLQYAVNNGNTTYILYDEYDLTETVFLNHSELVVKSDGAILQTSENITAFEVKGNNTDRLYRIKIEGLHFRGNGIGEKAIYIEYGNSIDVFDIDMSNFSIGLHVKDVWLNRYFNIHAIWNGIGFYAQNPETNNQFELFSFKVHESDNEGFWMQKISGVQAFQIEAMANGGDGILIENGEWNEFVSVLSDLNEGNGLSLEGITGTINLRGFRFTDLWSGSNAGFGIYTDAYTQDITITSGMLRDNQQDPIFLNGKYTVISSIVIDIFDETLSGILLDGTYNTITNCVFKNGEYGIEELANADFNIITDNVFRYYDINALKLIGKNTVSANNILDQKVESETSWWQDEKRIAILIGVIAVIIVAVIASIDRLRARATW